MGQFVFLYLVLPVAVGALTSAAVAILYGRLTRPRIEIVLDDSPHPMRFNFPNAGGAPTPLEFHHLMVRTFPVRWPVPGRTPAWSARGIIEVFRMEDGSRAIPDAVHVRWSSRREPTNIPEMLEGRRVDVHGHEAEHFAVIVKADGEDTCHIFSNESYAHARFQNPAWQLPPGRFRLRLSISYDGGPAVGDFELRNDGARFDQVRILPAPIGEHTPRPWLVALREV